MRILLLNPNTSCSLTLRMKEVAEAAAPEVEIVPATATRGFPYISSRAEADLAATFVLEIIAEHQDVDAVVIAAFGDPGLVAARELFDMPIVGMADAAMLTACALGERFAYVTFSGRLAAWMRNGVERTGLTSRFAGIFYPNLPFASIDRVQEDLAAPLVELSHEAAEAGADVLTLAGAPLAGFASTVAPRLAVPAVDPISAAVLQAASLVRLGVHKAKHGAFARPPAKDATGLTDALRRRVEHKDA